MLSGVEWSRDIDSRRNRGLSALNKQQEKTRNDESVKRKMKATNEDVCDVAGPRRHGDRS